MKVVLVLRAVDIILLVALAIVGIADVLIVRKFSHTLPHWVRLMGMVLGLAALIFAGLTFYHSM